MEQAVTDTLLALGGTALGVGGLAYAAMWPESQIFGPVIVAGDDPSEVALTFDDGPNGDITLRLLDILARHQALATFFLIGSFADKQPEIVRSIAAAGHAIGNHTMTHPWLHLQSATRIRRELGGCKTVLEDILGVKIRLFRPPHGSRRPFVIHHARQLGMATVQWNVAGNDWKQPDPGALVNHVQSGIARNRAKGRGSNILLHDGGDSHLGVDRGVTLQAVDRLLQTLPGAGIRAVPVAQSKA